MKSFFDFSKLAQKTWWFEGAPNTDTKFLIYGIYFIAALILILVLFSVIYRPRFRPHQRARYSFINLLITCILSSAVLLFARWQSLPGLNRRFLWLILFAVAIIWTGRIVYWRLFALPKLTYEIERKMVYKKYLPKSKDKNEN